jgi:hypothetical protein
LVGALVLGITAAIWVRSHSGDSELSTPLPSPNGYDDFIAAENELKSRLPDLSNPSAAELRGLINEHASALKRARLGLARNCRMPLDYSPGSITNMADLSRAKNLGWLFREEGHLAEMNSDDPKALQSYLEAIQFASKRFHGGLLIHQMVGAAVAKPAQMRLGQLISRLNADDCRKAITFLLEVESAEESIKQIQHRDYEWVRRVSKVGSLQGMIMKLLPQYKNTLTTTAARLHENTKIRRHLCIGLAARTFELDVGKEPRNVSDLVPKYLPNVPKDPTTGADLTFESRSATADPWRSAIGDFHRLITDHRHHLVSGRRK